MECSQWSPKPNFGSDLPGSLQTMCDFQSHCLHLGLHHQCTRVLSNTSDLLRED
jgi:hypothetical protein